MCSVAKAYQIKCPFGKLYFLSYICKRERDRGRQVSIFIYLESMRQDELKKVLDAAASQRGCNVVELAFNDDDNVFDVTIDKTDGSPVDLADCEYVHRAVLAAFDRNVEDYALTVGSLGVDPDEADEMLKTIE